MEETQNTPANNSGSKNMVLLGAGALFLLVAGWLMLQPKQKSIVMESTRQPEPSGAVQGVSTSEVQNITVEGGSYYFKPNEIRVKKGDKVKITFTNSGSMHNLTLDEFNVNINGVAAGQSGTAEFVADKAGTFEYYCSVGRHRQMGQKGTLIVE